MTCFCGVSKCGDSLGLLLVGDRTDVSQGGMESLSIVKRLQVLKDRLPSLCPALKGLPIDAIGFRRAKEALLQRVVIIIPFAAHAHDDAVLRNRASPPSSLCDQDAPLALRSSSRFSYVG